jgi:glycosyltransferase involved in cell wall biosynthesis
MTSLLRRPKFRLPVPLDSHSVTVVIPCLNEEGNLERLFILIEQAFQQLGFTLPVLLVDDGSTDNSPQILAQLCERYSFLEVIHHSTKQGVTGVWKTALAHVKTDWVLWGQADLESDPETDIPLLLQACVDGVDAVAGWRQDRGDKKIWASGFANSACRLVFGLKIHDMNWIKIVRRDLLAQLPVETITHRYLLAVLAGQEYKIAEVPTLWHPRHSGSSKFGKGRLVSSGLDFLRVCWWFYIQQHVAKGGQYLYAIAKAVKVGFVAGREAFYLQVKEAE